MPENIEKVLSEIQSRANKKFGSKLFKEIGPDPDLMKGFDALINSDLPEWKRKFYASTRKDFMKTETILDEEVAKKQNLFIEKEIKKAVNAGLLPKEYVHTIQNNQTNPSV